MTRCEKISRSCLVGFLFGLVSVLPAWAQSDSAAAYTFSTLAGYALSPSADGLGPNARFARPLAVAIDSSGNTYVADNGNATVRKITPAGVVTTIAGLAGFRGFADGMGSAARFWSPSSIAVDPSGNVYVGDDYFYIIKKLTPVGTNWMVTTFSGQLGTSGYRDTNPLGGGVGGRLNRPYGLAGDAAGNVYIADGPIRKVAPDGFLSTVANAQGFLIFSSLSGFERITNFVGVFPGSATAIAVNAEGDVYVTDQNNHTVWEINPVGSNWNIRLIAGAVGVSGSVDGPGLNARFQNPAGIAVDSAGHLFVTDGNHTIRRLEPDGTNWIVSTLTGSVGNSGNIDGVGTNALFYAPAGIAVDASDNLIVTDSLNDEIRKVTSAGIVRTLAGSTAVGFGSADGIGTGARFSSPYAVAVDAFGNVYVSDGNNHTIRQITSAGVVITLAGSVGNAGTVDGIGSEARFNIPDGIAVDSVGNLYVAQYSDGALRRISPAGVVSTIPGVSASDVAVDSADNVFIVRVNEVRKLSQSGTNWLATTIATVPGILSAVAATSDGRLAIVSGSGIQMLTPDGTNWMVSHVADRQPYHLAVDGAGNIFATTFFGHTVQKFSLTGTNWVVSTIGGLINQSGFYEGGNVDGAGTSAEFGLPYGIAADHAGNVYISDVRNHNIRKGVFTRFAGVRAPTLSRPPLNAALGVTLLPPEAGGQWRFPWELGWRDSGTIASNLAPANYPVEFRSRPGFLLLSPSVTVAVTNAGTTLITNEYFPTLIESEPGNAGSLTVNIGPSPPPGAGWRFIGDTAPFFPPGFSTNLAAGTYLIEFAPVGGRVKPDNRALQVLTGLPTSLLVNYLLAVTPPDGVQLPQPVPIASVSDVSNSPFGFNGQLQSDTGNGSGVAVQTNVVLTAAHVVFNDQTLSYVSQTYWYFQRTVGVFDPPPQAARGYYLLSGYAAQRTNDLQSGLYAPGQSTPQSRNLDVAALYFLAPVAGGGHGGYLPSDQTPNAWLSGASLKMLVGYPVDGSQFGDAGIVPGRMYRTDPQPFPLTVAGDPVSGPQQVYVAPWLLSYPGNSGGPLYAQFDGYYYPAGVYLGTLYSGIQPIGSLVRAIDSNVVNLITLAASQGDSGTNFTGGGVITIIPSQAISASNPGAVQFQLAPPAAVRAGAGWRLQGDTSFGTAINYTRAVLSTNPFAIEFKPIPGWNLPTNQAIIVLPNPIAPTVFTAFYTVTNPLLVQRAIGFGMTGTTGTVYRLEKKSALTNAAWLPVGTNTINSTGFNLVLPKPETNPPTTFYRLRWLP